MKTVIRLQSGIVAIEGFIQFERAVSLYSSLFLFPVAPALWIGIVSMNRRNAANLGQQDETVFPSIRFAYLRYEHSQRQQYWRGHVYILNRQGGTNLQGVTWHRLIKKSISCANTIGAVITGSNILTLLHLFVVTMPI